MKKRSVIPVIASINCTYSHEWTQYAKQLQSAGADGLELNMFFLPLKFDRSGEEMERLGNTLKLVINLEKNKIRHEQLFSYEYVLRFKEVFKKMYERRSEWSGYRVLVPTEHLTFIIVAPNGSKFVEDDIEVRVDGLYEIEDFMEEKRCREKCPPFPLAEGDLLMWEIENPKIACTYNLFFSLFKRKKPNRHQ